MTANAAYTNALTQGVQAKQAMDAKTALDAAITLKATQGNSSWQPAQSNVVQPQQAQPQQQAQSAQQAQPQQQAQSAQQAQPQQQAQSAQQTGPQQQGLGSLGSMLPQDANSYRAQSAPSQAPQQPLPAAADKAYAPLSPTNGPAILDHPELQKVTGAHNLQDTSMAVGDSPTFNAQQTYAAKGPNGQAGAFSLDRVGILKYLMDPNRPSAGPDDPGGARSDLANGLVKQWTDADLQSEQTKQKQLVLQHATLAGHIAAFESLPESMKPQAYAGLIQQAQQEGINTSGFLPATYDPADKTGMAQLKDFEAQASTVAEREKAQFDKINSTINQQKEGIEQQTANEAGRHNKAEEYLTNQRNQIEAQKAQAASTGSAVTPEALERAADMYHTTGNLPSMGMGQAGVAARVAVMNREASKYGVDSTALASAKANYGADTGSLKGLQKSLDTVSAFENTAGKNLDLFIKSAQNIVDTGSPLLNQPLRKINYSILGNTDQAAVNAARQVATTEIAKVTNNPSLSGTLSDSARHEIQAFNPESATMGQTLAVAKILKQDMANRHDSLQDQIGNVQGRISLASKSSTPAPATGQLPTLGAAAALKLSPGTHFRGTDGKEYVR
jgi:hypothetical protein